MAITKFAAYFYDNSSSYDMHADLIKGSLVSAYGTIIASVTSSGAQSAYRSGETTTIGSPLVDQQSASYWVEVSLPATADVRRVGVRVDYGVNVALPLVLKKPLIELGRQGRSLRARGGLIYARAQREGFALRFRGGEMRLPSPVALFANGAQAGPGKGADLARLFDFAAALPLCQPAPLG